MARLKLNLPTGVVVEKNILTCFEVDNKSYLILDAENIGSMGLPIILVCKINNNKVEKIVDASEWQQAKDYLKGIIAGNTMNYVTVPAEMVADEIYYTQLTLPLASFDVIKNSYRVEEANNEVVIDPIASNVIEEAEIDPVIPEAPVVEPVLAESNIEEPVISIDPVINPALETSSEIDMNSPVIPEMPVVEEPIISTANESINFADSKEAFMKACENMFDALVSKFQAELDSKK